jgi:hypothetical protein
LLRISGRALPHTAVLVLAMQLVKGRAVWLLLVFACVLPHAYGSQVFQTAETLAVPRPFAEAVIFPVEKNQPLAENLHASIWTPPHPRYVTDANDKMVWHEIDRYAGVPCGKEGRPNG